MTDFKASVKIEFEFMGKTEKLDAYINWSPGDQGIDERVVEFFDRATQAGLARYRLRGAVGHERPR